MALQILERKSTEMEIKVPGGMMKQGKLVACEVRDAKTDKLIERKDYANQPNMMFERVIHRICTMAIGSGETPCIEDEFLWSRLGTGDTPSTATTADLQTPALAWSNAIHMPTTVEYNVKTFLINTPVTIVPPSNVNPETYYAQEVPNWDPAQYYPAIDGDYSMKIRVSHAHPEVTVEPIVVKEVGYSNSATPAPTGTYSQLLNSRVVLAVPVSLAVGQYLVTTYEYELRLPSYRQRSFASIGVTGLGNTAGRVRLAVGTPAHGTTIAGSQRGQNIFHLQRALIISAVLSAASGNAGYGLDSSASSRLGGTLDSSLLGLGTGPSNSPTLAVASNTVTTGPFNPAQPVYQNDGERTINFWRARAQSGTDLINGRSLFCFGYQFLLDNPFNILFAQDIAISATLKWDLMRPIS